MLRSKRFLRGKSGEEKSCQRSYLGSMKAAANLEPVLKKAVCDVGDDDTPDSACAAWRRSPLSRHLKSEGQPVIHLHHSEPRA
jgi:hypothetical protein